MEQSVTVMILGHGVIGGQVAYDLAHSGRQCRLVLVGRDAKRLAERVNMTRFSAMQRGFDPQVEYIVNDLNDVDRTAEVIAQYQPHLLFIAASMQSWWVLPSADGPASKRLQEAHYGPWLPMHLALVAATMQAVKSSGASPKVVNAAFPDAVHPALAESGLSPDIGIGNVANNVPALEYIVSRLERCKPKDVSVRLVACHYVSHRMRYGDVGGAPTGFEVSVRGRDFTHDYPLASLLKQLSENYSRTPGLPGQKMVAASALAVVESLIDRRPISTHAPGPLGLPGGYPVNIGARGEISLALEGMMDIENAVRINSDGQVFDGIESIENGVIRVTRASAEIVKEVIGFDCSEYHWSEARERAVEMRSCFVKGLGSREGRL